MCPTNKVELVLSVELFDYILAKHIAHTPVIISPTLDVYFWIWPEEIAQKTSVRHILGPMLLIDDLKVIQIWTESTMHTKYSIIDDRSHWQHIEAKSIFFPQFDSISPLALVIKTVHSIDLLTLVISS